eukprot:Em0010g341a
MDLIDMRHCPDGTYKWIGHYMDHWSKFHVLFALCQKSAAEVALNLQNQVFSYLGTPKILHSDNGHEFVNAIVASLCKEWPGEVTIVNGRPRNPKCQSLVEQEHGTVEKMLGVRLLESDTDIPPWSEWLPIIQYQLNTTLHGVMKTTPYELVFGQPPRQSVFPGANHMLRLRQMISLPLIHVLSLAPSHMLRFHQMISLPLIHVLSLAPSHMLRLRQMISLPLIHVLSLAPSHMLRLRQMISLPLSHVLSLAPSQTLSDDQPSSESDDQPPSVSDTQHLSKSHAQDVSESDDQLQITVEMKSINFPQRIVKAISLLANLISTKEFESRQMQVTGKMLRGCK